MADIRESFPSLEGATGEGLALRAAQSGDSPVAKNGAIAFGWRDSAGNLILPQLKADGTIGVSEGAPGTAMLARNTHAGSTSVVDVAALTLAISKTYQEISFNASCYRETHFQLVQKDDATEVILDDIVVGPGAYTHTIGLGDYGFISGASGVQKLIVRGTNLNVSATMRARISATELA